MSHHRAGSVVGQAALLLLDATAVVPGNARVPTESAARGCREALAPTGTPARGAEPDRSGGRAAAAPGRLCGGLYPGASGHWSAGRPSGAAPSLGRRGRRYGQTSLRAPGGIFAAHQCLRGYSREGATRAPVPRSSAPCAGTGEVDGKLWWPAPVRVTSSTTGRRHAPVARFPGAQRKSERSNPCAAGSYAALPGAPGAALVLAGADYPQAWGSGRAGSRGGRQGRRARRGIRCAPPGPQRVYRGGPCGSGSSRSRFFCARAEEASGGLWASTPVARGGGSCWNGSG